MFEHLIIIIIIIIRHRLSHWSSSNQTVNMGQSSQSIRETSGDQQSERRHGQSSTALSCVTPQQWLAARTSAIRLRSATWRPCHPHRCWPSTESQHMWASSVSLQEDCMVCRAEGATRHHNLNDLVWRAMAKANIPALKEPSGLLRTDGKPPNGVTLLPWKQGKCVTWDVTVSDTLAQSYLHGRPRHQARQQRRQPKGKRTSIRHSLSHICLFQSRQKQWERLTRTAWTSWATLEGALHKAQTTTARAPSSSSDFPC